MKESICMIVFSHFSSDSRVKREAFALSATGYEVYCIGLGKRGEEKHSTIKNINTINIMKWIDAFPQGSIMRYFIGFFFFPVLAFFHLLRLHIKKINIAVIHAHNPPDHLILAGLFSKLIFKSKLILDRHEPYALQIISNLHLSTKSIVYKLFRLYEKIAYSIVDCIIVVNILEYNDVREISPNKEILIIRNSLDIDRIKNLPSEVPKNKNSFNVLYQGFVSKRRDVDTIINSIKGLEDEIPNLECNIFGDGNFQKEAIQITENLGMDGFCKFHGWVDQSVLFEKIMDADVCLITLKDIPVYHRATPNKLFEYMFYKKTIISADLPSMRYMAQDCSLFYIPGDHKSLEKQILNIWKNPDILKNSQNKMEQLVKQNDWKIDKEIMLKEYKTLLQNPKG